MSVNCAFIRFTQWPGLASQPSTTSSTVCGPAARFSPTTVVPTAAADSAMAARMSSAG